MAAKYYFKLSSILQRLLYEKRMNASELAREVDLPIPTVHRLVTGKSTRPYSSSLKPIADFFSLEIDQLLGEAPIPGWDEEFSKEPLEEVKTVPVIGWEGLFDLPAARLGSTQRVPVMGTISSETFALIMNDYSMEPILPKGTILIFEPQKHLVDRAYILVHLHQTKAPIIRQVLINGDEVFLKPLNPELHLIELRKMSAQDRVLAYLVESRVEYFS